MEPFEKGNFYGVVGDETGWSNFLGLGKTGFGQWFNDTTGITKHQEKKELERLDENPQTIANRPMTALPTQPLDFSYETLNKDGSLTNANRIVATEAKSNNYLANILNGLGLGASSAIKQGNAPAGTPDQPIYNGQPGNTMPKKDIGGTVALIVMGTVLVGLTIFTIRLEMKNKKAK